MRLAVNIDHIATIREARKTDEPDPVTAAAICELAGAQGITVHLRSDRRHIQDRDVEILRRTVATHLNVEMAATREMVRVAQTVKPHQVTLVPERKDELTTEGGLDVVLHSGNLDKTVKDLQEARIEVSIFVDPDIEQLRQCAKIHAPRVEINTGKFADSWKTGDWQAEVDKVATAARAARKMGLTVLGGHGLTYRNVDAIAALSDIEELNIGHSIIARAALVGLDAAVREMVALLGNPRSLPGQRGS
jgi:pyridoxine 5-phosphate synthase